MVGILREFTPSHQIKILFLLICMMSSSLGADTSSSTPPTVPPEQSSPGEKNGVTAKMKEDFLDRYRLVITAADPTKYLTLICLDGMDDAMRAVAANGAQHSMSYVAGRLNSLSFDWEEPDPNDTKPFEKNGFRYHTNLKPAVSLIVNIKRGPDESKDLPAALEPTLGIKDGQLMILGMIHEKLSESLGNKKEEKADD